MKTKNIDQSIGYIQAVNDVIQVIKELTEGDPRKRFVDSIDLIDKILLGQQGLNTAPPDGEYYTMDKINPKKPFKAIAGEDALFLNPVYNLNKNK